KFALSRLAQQIHSVFPSFSSPEPPRRTLISLHQLKIPFPFDQVAHAHVDAQTAAIFSRPAGVRPQSPALDQDRAFELDAFDRAVAHVALAHGHRAGLAVLEWPPAPAAPFDALDHETAIGPRMRAEELDRAAEQTVMAGGHLLRHGRSERGDDSVHHHGHDHAPTRHWRGETRHHDVAFGNDHFERAEGAFVDRI